MLLTTAGEAGIVLSRFFSGKAALLCDPRVDVGRLVLEVVGVAGVRRAAVGLVTDVRVVDKRDDVGLVVDVRAVEGRVDVLLAGALTLLRVVDAAGVDPGASDIRFGRAAMPSFLSSPFSSPVEATEGRVR